MPAFRTQKVIPHSPEEMFALVVNVESYPEFLPLCDKIAIRNRKSNDDGTETFISAMTVGYKAISEVLTTRVTADKANLSVLTEFVDGPFRTLENRWKFTVDERGCLVDFFITYEFKSFALSMLMGSIFDRAFRKFVSAFEERADNLYGKKSR